MNYKRNFIKHERTNNKDKKDLRKNEPFVLMFRDFIFFDVKSYECRNGDLYIRNIVDGIILKRYFRMGVDDQLTVFKNRAEFDEFVNKVKEEGYISKKEELEYHKGDDVSPQDNEQEDSKPDIHGLLKVASDNFVLENFTAIRNSETGKIDVIISTWDGSSVTRDECPEFFDDVVRVLEANTYSAKIFTKMDFM